MMTIMWGGRMSDKSNFEILNSIDVTKYVEVRKNGGTELKYLSWSDAWTEFCKINPGATYKIHKDNENNAYFGNSKIGYMVYVDVTTNGLTHEMWLPVLDGANNVLKDEPYEYETKYGKKKVSAIDIFDVNKAIMRALVKCLAMHGLGLYIYRGEDIPEISEEIKKENSDKEKNKKAIFMIIEKCKENNIKCDVERLNKMSIEELKEEYKMLKGE